MIQFAKPNIFFCSLQQMCVLLEQSVESICVANTQNKSDTIQFTFQNTRLECRQLVQSCQNAAKLSQSINEDGNSQSIHKVISPNYTDTNK